MRRVLLQLVEQGRSREFPLEDVSVCRIGRSEQSTVALSGDGRISRNHALVQRMDTGEYYLTDLGSRNGTVLNGRLVVSPAALKNGDVIRLGGCELRFVQEEDWVQPPPEDYTQEEKTTALLDLRLITVLVMDIRGFTALSRELGESRTSEMMGTVFRAAGLALAASGSYAQKYIGDAVMSIWVHDGARPSLADLQSVFRALCSLARIVEDMQRDFFLPAPVRFGAGLNCGVAGLGNMGSAARADHTAMGECVNKAFRLESASKVLDCPVVVGQDAYGFLDVLPELRALFQPRLTELKGYAQPERVYVAGVAEIQLLFAGV
ncbi:MAG: adenylate/guanylate cyclase domain-containing protein [Bryobacteraceae bacterium]|nr:adenylate/guanylate cyclase domain-containing protein [Bryobacteraceae bacterium]